MKAFDFLRTIVPAGGYYALVGIKNKRIDQKLFTDLIDSREWMTTSTRAGADMYFGCASFLTGDNRTKANVRFIQSFWIDLDCGEGTAYDTKEDGIEATKAFVAKVGLPTPWIVDSGRGLHLYWPLTTPILAPLWETYSNRLVELCAAQGLSIKDPGCSTDSARILRIPNTKNFKNPDDPLLVHIISTGGVSEWETIQNTLQVACGVVGINGFKEKPLAQLPKRVVDPLTASLAGNITSNFRTIMVSQGCGCITNAVDNQADTPEPLWRAVLSVAQVCDDRDNAIHRISSKHPGYNHAETEKKANGTGGPQSCIEFDKLTKGAFCSTCPNKGKFTGPIALGKQMATPPKQIALFTTGEDGAQIEIDGVRPADLLPELPWPYSRGIHGGIYKAGEKDEDGNPGAPVLVYEYNLDIIRRVRDPEKGETLIIHLQLPRDGIQEIVIPLADAQATETMKAMLGHAGVAAGKKQMEAISTYLTAMVKHMQFAAAAAPARSQMGWVKDATGEVFTGFVWGRTMFTPTGLQYCPPAAKSTTVANMMRESGTMEAWEALADRYAQPGFELYACCMLMAFGSILNPFTKGDDPVWIHLVSPTSGTGKTTLLHMINSIWGDPTAMKILAKDTLNSVEKRRVVFNNIAICQDEITTMSAEKLMDLAYTQSHGREKNRLNSNSQEMVNEGQRSNTLFTTGNNYVSDVLGAAKTNADGELARLIEIPFEVLKERLTGDEHFAAVLRNYGHAGPRYAKWLVANVARVKPWVNAVRHKFEMDFSSVSKERNWVAQASTGFAAGEILQQELGMLKSFSLPHLYRFWMTHMLSVRANAAEQVVSHENVLGDFINENYMNIIIPDRHIVPGDALTSTIHGKRMEREARNKLSIRWERDTNHLFISQHDLKSYCIKRNHSFVDMLTYYSKDAQFMGVVRKRMGAGAGVLTTPVKCLAFNVTSGELGDSLKDLTICPS